MGNFDRRYLVRWAIGIGLAAWLGGIAASYAQTATATNSQEQFYRAEQLFADQQYEEALRIYQQLLESPADPQRRDQILLRLGQTYAKLARDAEARNIYLKLIEQDPDGSYATIAVSYLVNLHAQRYQYQEAIRVCQQIAAQYPKTRAGMMAAYLVPTYLYMQGKTEEAIQAYRTFLEDYPSSIYRSSVINSLMALYAQRRQYGEAETLIQEHLRRQPDDIDLLESLAQLYQQQGRLDEALRMYQQVLEKKPDDTIVLEKLGEIYAARGDTRRAILEWQRIVALNPNQYYQHQRLADIYKEHELYDQAVKEYEAALRLQPRTAYLYTQLAEVYQIQNDFAKAVQTYARALNVLPPAYGGRAQIYASLAELYPPEKREQAFLEAEALVQRWLDGSRSDLPGPPNRINLTLALAELAFHRGDYETALARFRELASFYSDQGQALQEAARQLERTQEYLPAARFYQEIVRLFPNAGTARLARLNASQAYLKAGQWRQALDLLGDIPPNDVPGLLLRADILLHQAHDPQAALTTYEQIERVLGGRLHYEVALGKAEALILLGQPADDLLTPLLQASPPTSLRARLLLGHAHFFRAEFEQAAELYQQIVDQDPRSEWSNDALEFLALIRTYQDYFGQPLAIYAEALRQEWLGNPSEAIASYTSIREKFPQCRLRDKASMKAADLLVAQGNLDQAARLYQQIIAEQGAFAAEALFKLGGVYLEVEPARARQAYTQLLEDYPQSIYAPEARRQLRAILQKTRKGES